MIDPLDAAHVESLRGVPSGVVCDALGRLGLSGFTDGLFPFRRDSKMVGRARTVRYSARRGSQKSDFNIYRFVRSLDPGDILVIATDRSDSWIYGENLAHEAQYHGISGVVADCMARDGTQLSELDIPCFARGLAVRPPGFEIVATDVPVSLAGAQVNPGDALVGDGDGIVVVPGSHVADVALQALDLDHLEQLQEQAIAARAPLPELLAILGRKKIVKK